ncbi:MAG: caspase family protein [bacterium]
MRAALTLAAAALLALAARAAAARTLVVAIGNDEGQPGEVSLRFAERDAERFGAVMRRLGGVAAIDHIELRGETAEAVRRTLHAINARIRSAGADETALVVYYSGHADAAGLHLGRTTLAYDELQAILAGSPARVRVLVLDGCRSGGATRVKGARVVEETFDIALDDRIAVEGMAIMTSSTAGEDSHESERYGGSFFTHHLVAALLGAGDADGDARVTLSEAYAYAARRTLASSGRTRQLQHPTYAYDIKGRGDFVMTRLTEAHGTGRLVLHAPTTYLVREGHADGPLRAELTADRAGQPISLAAGDYFVQARFDDHYEEYRITVEPGASVALASEPPRRVAYARLVRKGGGGSAHELRVMAAAHAPVLEGHRLTAGAVVAYGLTLPWATLGVRGRFGYSAPTSGLDGTLRTYGLGLSIERMLDRAGFSAGIGLLVEGLVRAQTIEHPGAPSPISYGLALSGLVAVEAGLGDRWFLRLEGGPVTQLLRVEQIDNGARVGGELATRFGGFGALGLGVRFR